MSAHANGLIDGTIVERMIARRRDLHRHPELSWEERRTSDRVAEALGGLGIPHRRAAETGIIADLPGEARVPVVALRADLDALPIQEETGLPFASEREGVMHACGHDGHASMLLGAAEVLADKAGKNHLPAPVRLIFQPAEEQGAGALAMIEAGALDGVGMIFGGHLDRYFPRGTLAVTQGAVNASTDAFRIEINGQAGHAARPHEAVDAVVVGSLMVMGIQTIVSREVNPAHPAVVSVGRFDAGTVCNAIAGQAVLEGTIRTQDPEVREHFKKSVERIANSVGQLHSAAVSVEFQAGTPAVHNPPELTAIARDAATRLVGSEGVRELTQANMGGEDFAYYLEHVPGCYIRFGARLEGRRNFPAHSSKFDFDEGALEVGAAWLARVAEVAGQSLADTPEAE
jgi:hippurate hydrolase